MVLRTVCLLSCLSAILAVLAVPLFAAHGIPAPTAVPLKVPVYGPAGYPPPGAPTPMAAPVMAAPRPMMAAPMCPPPCAPPVCGPTTGVGFSPLSALVSVVTLPFRIIGGAVSSLRGCGPAACPPVGCAPMMPPGCGPMPPVKCKPGPMPQAAIRYSPMQ